MLPGSIRSLLALFVLVLLAVFVQGCSQIALLMKRPAQGDDCRSCHAPGKVAGAWDFSAIYAQPKSHHPVGVNYPLGPSAFPDYNQPNGQNARIAFFDRNGNGQADIDEIQLFGADIAVMVECGSCHRSHGEAAQPDTVTANAYLRFANTGSALCITCHRQ